MDAIVGAVMRIGQAAGISLQEHQSTPSGTRGLEGLCVGATRRTGRIEGRTRIQEVDFDTAAEPAQRHNHIISVCPRDTMLDRIGGKLGDAKPDSKNRALACTPARADLLQPAVDRGDVTAPHSELARFYVVTHSAHPR